MGNTDEVEDPDIPSIMVKRSACQKIKQVLANGVKVRLQVPVASGPSQLDAAFDNGIIVHEYGHGISNRLTGGPSEVNCLFNDEQMGEGWSDFFTLVMTTHPDVNEPEQARGIGNYVMRAAPGGQGIRRQPYSTDFSINNQTYDDIITSSTAPHPVGEIWAATLWDLYWAMIEEHGWDDNIYTGNGGNNKAIQLVMDGLKLQRCNPGFIDGRDAILAADQVNYGGENECLIWKVFARRGLGWGAIQGESFDRRDGVPSFDTNPSCSGQLLISKKVTEEINPGDTIKVNIRLTNYTNSIASNIVVTDNIPAQTSYMPSAETIEGINGNSFVVEQSGNQLVFNLSEGLNRGESTELSYFLLSNPELASNRRFFDGAEEGLTQFTTEDLAGNGEWVIDSSEVFQDEKHWFIATTEEKSDQVLQTLNPVFIDGQQPVLRFYHKYVTEPNFDGGIVQVSRDGVNWEVIDDAQFFKNPYRGVIAYSAFIIPNAKGFWGEKNDYIGTYIDLEKYKGEELYIRFRFANLDQNTFEPEGGLGWLIDNVEVMDMLNYNSEVCVSYNQGASSCAIPAARGTIVNSNNLVITDVDDLDYESQVEMRIFPNPSIGNGFNVEIATPIAQDIFVSLYSMEGKMVKSINLSGGQFGSYRTFINTSRLAKGMYTVQLTTSKGVVTRKMMIN